MARNAFVTAQALSNFELAPDHPFKPLRAELAGSLLEACGLIFPGEKTEPQQLGASVLSGVHDPAYIELVRDVSGGKTREDAFAWGLGTGDNPIFPGMHDAVLGVCEATATAVELVASGQADRAMNLSGGLHHAHPDRASGFCVYNDLAVAIEAATRRHGCRIACIDLDAHHGDGTQEIFYERGDVLTVSLHESGRYLFPGTGHTYESGRGAGRGSSVNAPLEPFTEDDSYLEVFEAVVPAALEWFRPDLIILQAGADPHRHDPLADLSLTLEGMTTAWRRVARLADEFCHGRLVATGGGGYDAYRTVPRAWAHLWAIMTDRELPAELPAGWILDWQERGVTGLPQTALDGPADFSEQPRRTVISNQNRAMLARLEQAAGRIRRELGAITN